MNNYTVIQLLPGVSGIKQAYELSLTSKEVDIVCLSNNYEQVVGDYFTRVYSPKLYGGSIKTREILPDNFENREYAKKKDGIKNQVRFLKVSEPSESDYLIFDNQLVLISYNPDSPFALVINDKNIVGNLKNQFEILWSKLL